MLTVKWEVQFGQTSFLLIYKVQFTEYRVKINHLLKKYITSNHLLKLMPKLISSCHVNFISLKKIYFFHHFS